MNQLKPNVKSPAKQIKKAIKKGVKAEERALIKGGKSREAQKAVVREIRRDGKGGGLSRNQAGYFKSVFTRRDAAKLAWMRCVADPFTATAVPIPPLLAPGVSTSCPRMYPITLKGFAVSNASGRVFIGLNADSWFANPAASSGSAPTPWLQYLGNSTANGGTRGYPCHYTTNAYVGTTVVGSTGASYPGPAITQAAGTAGLTFLQLPNNFIDVQLNNDPASSNATQRYSCVAASLRARPTAPVSGSLLPTGTLMMVQQILGDVLTTNPAAASGSAPIGGVDAYAYVGGLTATNSSPLTDATVGREEWDLLEWPAKGGERSWLSASAIPNQSCCFGCWTPAQTGNSTVGYPQLAVLGSGMGSGATIEFEAKLVYAFYGGVSYQENYARVLPAVPQNELVELSSSAVPHLKAGAAVPPGRAAAASVAQAAVNEGRVHPKAAADWIRDGAAAIETVTGSSVGELIGEGLGFLGGLLL